jgi:hypothetical protein
MTRIGRLQQAVAGQGRGRGLFDPMRVGVPVRRRIRSALTSFPVGNHLDLHQRVGVVRSFDGSANRDGETCHACDRADLPAGGDTTGTTLRHSYGAHAAMFGVNPWRLQAWLGHKRIDETMLHVLVAENHRREIPEAIIAAGRDESDPDRRVLKMLGARGSHVAVASSSSLEHAGGAPMPGSLSDEAGRLSASPHDAREARTDS